MNNKEQKEYTDEAYKSCKERLDFLYQRQGEEDDKTDKWMMTMAAGSFGLSFIFIDQIVPIKEALHIPFLIVAWSCFLAVLILKIVEFTVSSFMHLILVDEEVKNLDLIYEGKNPINKERSIFFDPVAILGYISILLFLSGSLCLILFITKNLL
jgi:hypothetical protein